MQKANGAPSPYVVSKGRLEVLFDGIFAIAMTILVLEVKVPELADRHSVKELWSVLVQHGSSFFGYFFSFGMLGLFWYRHNKQYHYFQHITRGMVFLHMLQLSLAAFFPFCAGTVGRGPSNYLAMSLYAGCILAYVACTTLLWLVAKRAGAMAPELDEAVYRQIGKRNLRGLSVISVIFGYNVVMAIVTYGR
jgi:uncharacterized membrane protein